MTGDPQVVFRANGEGKGQIIARPGHDGEGRKAGESVKAAALFKQQGENVKTEKQDMAQGRSDDAFKTCNTKEALLVRNERVGLLAEQAALNEPGACYEQPECVMYQMLKSKRRVKCGGAQQKRIKEGGVSRCQKQGKGRYAAEKGKGQESQTHALTTSRLNGRGPEDRASTGGLGRSRFKRSWSTI